MRIMTSNSVVSGAGQTAAAVPMERVTEHTAAKTVKAQIPDEKEAKPRVNEPAEQLPVQVYNSRGQIVPNPSSPQADLTA
jgi:hypothetical protein